MKLTTNNAYEEANKFDENLSKALELNPPSKDNYKFWLCYCRTIKSTLDIVEGEILEKLRKFRV